MVATVIRPYPREMKDDFLVTVDGVTLGGTVEGEGDPVLLLHGGPGLGFEYLEPVVEELRGSFRVASYQQRGLAPSSTDGPFTVADQVADVRQVLDFLGWEQAVVVGHSWGGHLAVHVAHDLPDRVRGALSVDPWGCVGDGGTEAFVAELEARTPAPDWQRAEELDELALRGEATDDQLLESLQLIWPAYYAEPEKAPPMPPVRMSTDAYAETMASAEEQLPRLEAALSDIRVPVGFVAGAASPMPSTASTETAERIPGAWAMVLPGVGHFVWHERPGAVLEAVRRLVGHD
jgi:pimeloyl-ACP methyl ester carboxylesterase